MKKPGMMLLGLMLAACSATTEQPDDMPVLHETTLTRPDGTAITVEELESLRPSAIATADTIARIDRLLAEPWAEQRDARLLVEHLRASHPSDTRLAQTLWESTEPGERTNGRRAFREYGLYANQFLANGFGPRVRPPSLEAYIAGVLEGHSDADSRALLLAAWRRFAPVVKARNPAYLASAWQIELDYVSPVNVTLVDSLLGPFERVTVGDEHPSFFGPTDSYEGYTASVLLLDLLTPGPASPVARAVGELRELATGSRSATSFAIANGTSARIDDVDIEFLNAALTGLTEGMAAIDPLPQGVKTFSATFSYLVDRAEARATIAFARKDGGWELRLFEYEPAAANLLGGNARLDLLPTIRTLLKRNRQG